MEQLVKEGVISKQDYDQATAQQRQTEANVAEIKATIERKTIRAPFRARVGIADVHPGQYLNEGTQLTTLQGVDAAAHVDFAVAQQVGAELRAGQTVDVLATSDSTPIAARIVAVDARVDPTTRTTMVRAIIFGAQAPAPGSSVRVLVPSGPAVNVVVIPVSALRRGPSGDHVFVIARDSTGTIRAHVRPVHSGPMLGDEIVILDGLATGEQVAASGSFKLRESVPVAVGAAQGAH